MGGSSIPRHTSTMASRTSSGVGGRKAVKSKVNHLCSGGNGLKAEPRACSSTLQSTGCSVGSRSATSTCCVSASYPATTTT